MNTTVHFTHPLASLFFYSPVHNSILPQEMKVGIRAQEHQIISCRFFSGDWLPELCSRLSLKIAWREGLLILPGSSLKDKNVIKLLDCVSVSIRGLACLACVI
jgi:hypothetical protein